MQRCTHTRCDAHKVACAHSASRDPSGAIPAGRGRWVASMRSADLKEGLQQLPSLWRAAWHQARAPPSALAATRKSTPNIVDARCADSLVPLFGALVPLIAHVDEHIAPAQQRQEGVNRCIDSAPSWNQQQHATRPLQAGDKVLQVGEGLHGQCALLLYSSDAVTGHRAA